MFENLLPNGAILKSPMNWFLVAFALCLMAFIGHVLFKELALDTGAN